MKILTLVVVFISISFSLKSQDIIVTNQGNTINCSINKLTIEGVTFTLPPEEVMYRKAWGNIKQLYYKNTWQNIDSLSATLIPKSDTLKDFPQVIKIRRDKYRYLEKAGTNLLLGITIPIGGAIVGGGITLLGQDNEGAEAVGYFIFGSSLLVGLICDISAGVNLIKSQRYIDHLLNTNTKGFKIGGFKHGVGIGYRF